MREGHDYLLYAAIRVALNRSEVICEYASTSWEIGAPGSNGPRCLIALTEHSLLAAASCVESSKLRPFKRVMPSAALLRWRAVAGGGRASLP